MDRQPARNATHSVADGGVEQVFNVQAVRSQNKSNLPLTTRYTRRQLSPWGNTIQKYFILFLACQIVINLAIFTTFNCQILTHLVIIATLKLSIICRASFVWPKRSTKKRPAYVAPTVVLWLKLSGLPLEFLLVSSSFLFKF